MLLEIFIIQKGTSFLLVRRAFTKKEIQVEGSLFSGMISAIALFTTSLQIGEIQNFQTKDHQIMIHPFEDIIVVGIVEEKKEDPFVEQTLRKIAVKFQDVYTETLLKWNGDINLFSNFPAMIDDIVYSEFAHYYIEQNFPQKLISVIREIKDKFEPRIIRFIGKDVGRNRAEILGVNLPKLKTKQFKKALLKELNLFSICRLLSDEEHQWQIEMNLCPFCRGIVQSDFSCEFITGFIDGFVNQFDSEAQYKVNESECAAHGDDNCKFRIIPTNI
ncbi:MAG: hypothetical protein E4G98_05640 [Promethearchaeota archaeon]|nr:MAG: hypothetical protein E4G98_05640 [Candidatus Lokiarchaeota archaeon]